MNFMLKRIHQHHLFMFLRKLGASPTATLHHEYALRRRWFTTNDKGFVIGGKVSVR